MPIPLIDPSLDNLADDILKEAATFFRLSARLAQSRSTQKVRPEIIKKTAKLAPACKVLRQFACPCRLWKNRGIYDTQEMKLKGLYCSICDIIEEVTTLYQTDADARRLIEENISRRRRYVDYRDYVQKFNRHAQRVKAQLTCRFYSTCGL